MPRAGNGPRGWLDDPLRDPVGLGEDDLDEEPVLEHYRRQAARIRTQLETAGTADPRLVEKLSRDLAAWDAAIARETLDGHWTSGEGDRKLF